MKRKTIIILIGIFVLVCGVIAIINIPKVENNKLNQNPPIYTHTASCYSGYSDIGNAVLELKGNESETKVIGRTIISYTITDSESEIYDKLGVYHDPEQATEEKIKEILYTQTQKLDLFTIKEIDRKSNDKYTYEINFEYSVNKSFQEYVELLENAEKSDYRFTCIIDDDSEILGTWCGVDNNFVYNTPYNVKITFNSSNTGELYASKVDNSFPQDKEYIVKYNVVDNKIKVVYLQKETIKNTEYLAWHGAKEFDIQEDELSYTNYGEKVILNKQDK